MILRICKSCRVVSDKPIDRCKHCGSQFIISKNLEIKNLNFTSGQYRIPEKFNLDKL